MRGRVALRDVGLGAGASVAALAAMAAVAVIGLLLLDADRLGGIAALTAAVVMLATGGSVEIAATPSALPISLQGVVEVMPLGVSLVGALVLGALLVRGRGVGLLVRGGTAVAVLLTGIAAVALSVRGTIVLRLPQVPPMSGDGSTARNRPEEALPGGVGDLGGALSALDIGFSVAMGPTLVAAACWTVTVVAVCWVALRMKTVARAARMVTLSIGALTVVIIAVAWMLWGPAAAGGVILGWQLALLAALLIGLGVPWSVHSDGLLASLVDGTEAALGAWPLAPGGPLTWVALAVLLCIGIIAARADPATGGSMRRALVTAAVLASVVSLALTIFTLLTRVSVDIGVLALGSVQPVLVAGLDADPWLAAGAGLVAGAAAGFAGSLLVSGMRKVSSIGWRTWTDRIRR